MHHPWREFRALTDWTLKWSELPEGVLGLTDFRAKTVTLTLGMDQAQRRCTIAHETEHILRGYTVCEEREEFIIDRNVSRLLLPSIKDVADTVLWHQGDCFHAAEELWVDEDILRMRLRVPHPSELHYLRRRFTEEIAQR